MKEKSLDLSGKVEAGTVEVLRAIHKVAQALSIPYFIVGAASRDMILMHGYGISPIRTTGDIDLGVMVRDWEHYRRLRDELLSTGDFRPTRINQRLNYKNMTLVDLIPFGAIADPDHTISWPHPGDTKMNVLGFDEAYRNSKLIKLRSDPEFEVPSASPAGLVVMKLILWNDKPTERRRDAEDCGLILANYLDAGNQDRIFNEEPDWVKQGDFDYVRAGAKLLGKDMARIASQETATAIHAILCRETSGPEQYRLVEGMMKGVNVSESKYERVLQLLSDLKSEFEKNMKRA
jgi:predicted nucleotidyltransferase